MVVTKGKTGKEGKRGKTGAVGPRWRDADITKMDVKLDKLISAIYEGNGHKPVMERLAIIEEHMTTMLESSVERDRSIAKIAESCGESAGAIKTHALKPHLHAFMGNFKFWGYLLLTFMLAHEAIEWGRPLLSALIGAWTGVKLP